MKHLFLSIAIIATLVLNAQDRGARPNPAQPLTTQQNNNSQRGGGGTSPQPAGGSEQQSPASRPRPANINQVMPAGTVPFNYMVYKMALVGKDEISDTEKQESLIELKRSMGNLEDADEANRQRLMEAYEQAQNVKTKEDYLNQLGLLGWEIVQVVPYTNEKGVPMSAVYLKRKAAKAKQ